MGRNPFRKRDQIRVKPVGLGKAATNCAKLHSCNYAVETPGIQSFVAPLAWWVHSCLFLGLHCTLAHFRPRRPVMSIRSLVTVVLNWCAEEDSAKAIASILTQGEPGVTVLIVDNASPDGSGDRLAARFPSLPYLQTGANLGYAGGNQRAIEWALERNADAVLLINDDATLQPHALGALRSAMDENPRLGGCAPTVLYGPPHHDRIWWAGGAFVSHRGCAVHWHMGEHVEALPSSSVVQVTALSGCVMLLRTKALRDAGGLDPAFFSYVEDAELSLRFRARGWELAWIPTAMAHHHCPYPQPDPSPWAITQLDRNRRLLASRHYRGRTRLQFTAWYYPSRVVVALRYLAKGDAARAAAVWRGMTAPLP